MYKYLSFSLTFTKALKKFHFSGVFFGRFSLRIHRCQSESDQTYKHPKMTSPLRLVNNPAEIEEKNLCFINAPTQASLNLLKLKGFLTSAVHVQTTKLGVVIKVFVFIGLLKKLFPSFLCPVLSW